MIARLICFAHFLLGVQFRRGTGGVYNHCAQPKGILCNIL